jgi:hypothetical protein
MEGQVMIRRFLCFCFVLTVVMLGEDFPICFGADESPDLIVGELPASEDGVLRAFTPPDKKESQQAASRVFGVLLGTVFFVVILFILLALFYSRKTGLPKPTVLRRGKKEAPTSQREKEPEERIRYTLDEE